MRSWPEFKEPTSVTHAIVVPLFVPAPHSFSRHVKALDQRLQNTDIALDRRLKLPQPEVAVDLSWIRIEFAPDLDQALPEIIRREHASLALLDKELLDNDHIAFALFQFQPPSWEERITRVDVTDDLKIKMEPSREWVIFRDLGERYGIDLSRYRACAIFDISYRHCLLESIRLAAKTAPSSASRVSAARLAFSLDSPCGIKVLEVSYDTNATPPQ
jgi:DNA-directed RNA polymerase subunit L